jgi:hypothetical protein
VISRREAAGVASSASDYQYMIDQTKTLQASKKEQRDALQKELDAALADSSLGIDKNSDWAKEQQSAIDQLDKSINEDTKSIYEMSETIQEQAIKKFESIGKILDSFAKKLSNVADMIEKHGKTVSDDVITDQISANMRSISNNEDQITQNVDNLKSDLQQGGKLYTEIKDAFGVTLSSSDVDNIVSAIVNNDGTLESVLEKKGLNLSNLTGLQESAENIWDLQDTISSTKLNNEDLLDQLIQNRQSTLEDYKDYLEDIKTAQEKALELQKAQYDLDKALNNKSVRTWNGSEWVYTADTDAIKDAQETLDDLEYDELIDSIDDAIDSLDDLADIMNLYLDNGDLVDADWKSIVENAGKISSSITDAITNGWEKVLPTMAELYDQYNISTSSTESPVQSSVSELISSNTDTIGDWISTEKLLTSTLSEDLKKLTALSNSVDISKLVSTQVLTGNIIDPATSFVGDVYRTNPTQTTNQIFNITLPNVTDSTKATELMSDLQSLSLKKMQYFNKQV